MCFWTGLCCAHVKGGWHDDGGNGDREGGAQKFYEVEVMYENLGEAYREPGWYEETKEVLRDGINRFPDCEAHRDLLGGLKKEDETSADEDGHRHPERKLSGTEMTAESGLTKGAGTNGESQW